MLALKPLIDRLRLVVRLGRLTGVKLSGNRQVLQIVTRQGEAEDNLPRLQPYGFASMAPLDSRIVTLSIGGNRVNALVILADADDSLTVQIAQDETLVWQKSGTILHLRQDGSILVKPSSGTMEIDADVHITKTLTADTDVFGGGKSLKGHVHGGVQGGSSDTGPPA